MSRLSAVRMRRVSFRHQKVVVVAAARLPLAATCRQDELQVGAPSHVGGGTCPARPRAGQALLTKDKPTTGRQSCDHVESVVCCDGC